MADENFTPGGARDSGAPVLATENITKSFGNISALRGVNFSARAGEVAAIVGDNGSGKSTFIKILSGNLAPDGGVITVGGRRYARLTPKQSQAAGISTVYQDLSLDDYRDVAEAIRNMTTRGAPSIGATAAYAMCLAALKGEDLETAARDIKAARPTANDLFYAVDRMAESLAEGADPVEAADTYAQSMVDKCIAIGKYGAPLIKDGFKVMTHCNAGALATCGWGTALGVIRAAHAQGKIDMVYADDYHLLPIECAAFIPREKKYPLQ